MHDSSFNFDFTAINIGRLASNARAAMDSPVYRDALGAFQSVTREIKHAALNGKSEVRITLTRLSTIGVVGIDGYGLVERGSPTAVYEALRTMLQNAGFIHGGLVFTDPNVYLTVRWDQQMYEIKVATPVAPASKSSEEKIIGPVVEDTRSPQQLRLFGLPVVVNPFTPYGTVVLVNVDEGTITTNDPKTPVLTLITNLNKAYDVANNLHKYAHWRVSRTTGEALVKQVEQMIAWERD